MKKWLVIVFCVMFSGCASVTVPQYIADKYSYKQKFYAEYDDVFKAVIKTSEEFGWTVTNTVDPAIYERSLATKTKEDLQALFFVDVKKPSSFLRRGYARANIFLRAGAGNVVELEVRYLKVSTVYVKTTFKYRNDKLINRFMKDVEGKI